MRFLELIETINVFEAARDRYMQMFAAMDEVSHPKDIQANVDWAIRTLKKSDRVVWYLRLYRLYLLKNAWAIVLQSAQRVLHEPEKNFSPGQRDKVHNQAIALEATYKKELANYVKKSEVPADRVEAMMIRVASTDDFRTSAEHFFSQDIPAVHDYVFGWKTWAKIVADLERIEDAHKKKQERMIPIQREGITTVLRFSDGSEWIDLHKSSCDIEAKAMGHCGNTAGYNKDDTILTYRTIEKDPKTKQKVWVPHLTFILDTSNGMLGEMKGFNNQHPDRKYHNVIIELLKLPIIKGIVGGGYKPENNFALRDLPEDTFKQMMESKPGLGTLTDHYALTGEVDHALFNKIEHVLGNAGLPVGDFDHNAEEKIFYIDGNIGPDIDDVYRQYGEGPIDEDPYVEESQVKGFFENIDNEKLEGSLEYYVQRTYGVHPKNLEEIYDTLKEENDDLINIAEQVIKEIHVDGIRAEAESWLDNLYDETPVYFHQEGDKWQLLSNEDEFMHNILPKIQKRTDAHYGRHLSWEFVLGGHFLPDPSETYANNFGYGDEQWFDEAVERQFLANEEVRKILVPTPEEMGQLRLFKDEEEKRKEEEKKQMRRLAASR